jgi:uncharacterized protein (TIRG00374 family)
MSGPGDAQDGVTPADDAGATRRSSLFREVADADLRAAIPEEERARGDRVEYPLVTEDDAGAIPLGKRLRDPRTLVSFLIPLGVLVLLAVALPGFKLHELPDLILNANPWWLLAALGVYYLGFPLRGYRWSLLLRGTGEHVRVRDATEIIFLSWLVNCVVPAKLGDVYRAYLLRVTAAVAISKTFGTIFIERTFDLFAIVTLGLAAGYWSLRDTMDDTVRLIFLIGLVVVGALCLGLLLVRNFGRRFLVRLPVPKRIVSMYDLFEEGLFSVDRRTMPVIVVVTGLIWTTEALRLLFVVEAMSFDIMLGVSGAFFVALIASLLTAVPLTPAGVGLVEGSMVFILHQVYDVPQTEALAIALVDRAISVLSIIVFGSIAYVLSSKTKPSARPAESPGDA